MVGTPKLFGHFEQFMLNYIEFSKLYPSQEGGGGVSPRVAGYLV